MPKIPEKLINYRVYNEGADLMGTADISLPDIEYLTESISGAGIAGEIDGATIGHTSSMTVGINFRTVTKDCIKLLAPKAHLLDLRGATQSYDPASGEYEVGKLNIVTKVIPKKVGLGKMASGSPMDTSGEYETIYLKITIDGETKVEIDKINYIFIVDGVDYLKDVKEALGL